MFMGICQSKNKTNDKICLVAFNLNQINTSFYATRILSNFIKKFENKRYIICVQGLRNLEYNKNKNDYLNSSFGLLTNSNLELVSEKVIPFHYERLLNFNSYNYGFQHLKFKLDNCNINVFNIELIKDSGNLYDFDLIRKKQIIHLINFITNLNSKVNIILGTFYDFKSKYENLVKLSSIEEIYKNLNDNSDETLIFLHLKNEFKDISFIKEYEVNGYKINIKESKTHNLEINDNLAFEIVIKIKKTN